MEASYNRLSDNKIGVRVVILVIMEASYNHTNKFPYDSEL